MSDPRAEPQLPRNAGKQWKAPRTVTWRSLRVRAVGVQIIQTLQFMHGDCPF